MNTAWYYYFAPALATLIIGFFAGLNGWQSNRITKQHNTFEQNSERLEQASNLMNDALTLVNSLRSELIKTQEENEKLRENVKSLHEEFEKVQGENAKLREMIESLKLRVTELEKLNENLKAQLKARPTTPKRSSAAKSDGN